MYDEPLVIMFDLNNTNLTPYEYFILESVIGYTLNVLLFITMIPQIYKAFKSKLTDDISYKFLYISIATNTLEMIYGILINQIPILLTGIICTLQVILLFIAKKLYDNPQEIKIKRRESVHLKLQNIQTPNIDDNTDDNAGESTDEYEDSLPFEPGYEHESKSEP